MADKVRINENALAVAYPNGGKVIAKTLNALPGFVERLSWLKENDLSGLCRVSLAGSTPTASVDSLDDYGTTGFMSSWLAVGFTETPGDIVEQGWLLWLPDIIKEPAGPYIVYEVSVDTGRLDHQGFLLERPDIPDKFIPHSDDNQKSYIGVTSQGVINRLIQHARDAVNGTGYVFHRFVLRQFNAVGASDKVQSRVLRTGLTRDQAMDAEEKLVENATLYPRGLNAIPGGYAGMRYLAERNFKTNAKRLIKNRAGELTNFFKSNPGNPLLALRLQSDDELISRIICKNPRNFGLSEVRHIRAMAELGYTEEQIAEEVKANQQRIHNLLTEKTYSRVA